MENARHLTIGKVVGTHGIMGHLKVLSYADSLDPFAPGKGLVLSRQGKPAGEFIVTSSRPHKRVVLLALQGINRIEDAEALIGCDILMERSALPALDDGSYYWLDIIGLVVYTRDERRLGRIDAVFPTGSNDVYVVREGKKETLIPAIESVVIDIDLDKGIMKVDLPEGLED